MGTETRLWSRLLLVCSLRPLLEPLAPLCHSRGSVATQATILGTPDPIAGFESEETDGVSRVFGGSCSLHAWPETMTKSPNYHIGPLLRVSAMLAGILAWEIVTGPIFMPEAALKSVEVKSSVMIPNDTRLEKPAISTFSEFVARPLFTPTRRPPPTKTEPNIATTAPKPENLQLIGVIISEGERMALLQTLATGDVTRAVEGQSVGGWEVHAINPTQVVLKRGNASEVVMINAPSVSNKPSTANNPPLSGQTNSSATGSPASAPPVSAVPE
jgi:hypothetical protein